MMLSYSRIDLLLTVLRVQHPMETEIDLGSPILDKVKAHDQFSLPPLRLFDESSEYGRCTQLFALCL